MKSSLRADYQVLNCLLCVITIHLTVCGQRKAHMREEQRTVFIIIVLVYAYRERNYHIVSCVCVGQGVIVYFVNMLSSAVVVIQGSSPHVCKGLAPLVLLVCISIANFNSLS